MSYIKAIHQSEPSVAVIGAGITGITTAYSLLRRGCRVTVFERHPYAAMEMAVPNRSRSYDTRARSA